MMATKSCQTSEKDEDIRCPSRIGLHTKASLLLISGIAFKSIPYAYARFSKGLAVSQADRYRMPVPGLRCGLAPGRIA